MRRVALGKMLLLGVVFIHFLVFTAFPSQADSESKIIASDRYPFDEFGYSVAISGKTVVVGAWQDTADEVPISGSAYVYQHDGSNWAQVAKLTASDAILGHHYGISVGISEKTIVIGAQGDDDKGDDSGAAYVYQFDGTNWVQVDKLTASDGAYKDYFGCSVAIDGNTIVIGSIADDDKGYNSGSVYVYQFDGTNWVQVDKLTASDGAYEDHFGCSVGIDGNTVIVGARTDDEVLSEDSGSAYVFQYESGGWNEKIRLIANDPGAGDYFGWSVGISGDKAVVGAYRNDDEGIFTGSAYAYQNVGNDWMGTKLTPSDAAAWDASGHSVAISEDTIIVGAPGKYFFAGSAYVYRYDGTTWSQQELTKLTASDGAPEDLFGWSVAISGNKVIAGACRDDTTIVIPPYPNPFPVEDSGSAYVYDIPFYLIEELVDLVIDLNIQHGITNNLDAKLDAAVAALEDLNQNNDVAAANSLTAFVNAVEAQSGKAITEEDADALIVKAQAIIDLLIAS